MKKLLFLVVPVILFMSCSKKDAAPYIPQPPVSYLSTISADFALNLEEPKDAILDGNAEFKVGDNITIKVMVQIQNDYLISGEISFLNAEEVGTPEIERIRVPIYTHNPGSETGIDCYDNSCDNWITINFTVPQSLEGRIVGMTLSLYGNATNATATLTPAFKVVQ